MKMNFLFLEIVFYLMFSVYGYLDICAYRHWANSSFPIMVVFFMPSGTSLLILTSKNIVEIVKMISLVVLCV